MLFSDVKNLVVSAELHLLAYARCLTGNDDDAFDLLQEASVRALERYDEIRSPASFYGWLRTVMRNLHYERVRRTQVVSLDALPTEVPDTHVSVYTNATGYEWEDGLEDEYDYLRQFLNRLQPALQRFLTAVIEERDRERVCARLGIEPRGFSMYLSRLKVDLIALGAKRVMFPEGPRIWYVEVKKGHPVHSCYRRMSQTCLDMLGDWHDPDRVPKPQEKDLPLLLATGCLTILLCTFVNTASSGS